MWIWILLLAWLANANAAFAQSGASEMTGLSNSSENSEKRYITAGDRSYFVGTQDGNFPDLGSHVKGEMGGLWLPPIKLLDGFWAKLTDEKGDAEWLSHAREFVSFPYGSKFLYAPVLGGIEVERFQYCPQGKAGMVVEYSIKNDSKDFRKLTIEFVAKTDVSPVWFSKENKINDAADSISWNAQRLVFVAKDNNNPWFAVWGSGTPAMAHAVGTSTPIVTMGLGKQASTTHSMQLKAGQRMTMLFFIAGSDKNVESALSSYDDIFKNHDKLLADKQSYYASIIDRGEIEVPDKKLQTAYTWAKVNSEWLVCDLPGYGRFLGAGAIEYPWLFGCDNSYALQGVVAAGEHELAKSTLRVIKHVSEKTNGNGRIIHEMSSNGFVYNKGNTQETAHFAVAVWKVFEWTGDVTFLKEMYPYIKQGIHWLLTTQDENRNMFPEGYGIMEVRGLNAELIDVAVYTQQALEAASKMAAVLKESAVEKGYAEQAKKLKDKINKLFWDDAEGSYCDFYGTREQAIATTRAAIEQVQMDIKAGDNAADEKQQEFYNDLLRRLNTIPEGTQKGWFTNKNWVISTPMESGIAPANKAIGLLDKVRSEHTGEYGPFLSAVEGKRMMTIATGVQAAAEAAYGRTEEAMWYVDKIVQTFGRELPGSISEMMPDYGCPVQAWTMYGLAVPLLTHVFGMHPDAYHQTIMLSPNLPSAWDHIKISKLPVGNNSISFDVRKTGAVTTYNISCDRDDWTFVLQVYGLRGAKYTLNGKSMTAHSDELKLHGRKNELVVTLSSKR
jgi:hypothetical protein